MNLLRIFRKTKAPVAGRPSVEPVSPINAYLAGRPSAPTAAERWRQLSESYPKTYAAFQQILDLRPDLIPQAIEYKTSDGPQTTFVLADGDFETLYKRMDNSELKLPWPIIAETRDKPNMWLFRAGDSGGGPPDEKAANAIFKIAEILGFITVENRPGLNGVARQVLTAGPTKYPQPNPVGSGPNGRPTLALVT